MFDFTCFVKKMLKSFKTDKNIANLMIFCGRFRKVITTLNLSTRFILKYRKEANIWQTK